MSRVPETHLSVVVPSRNEAACLEVLLPSLSNTLDALCRNWEIVLVDDGSADGTFDLVRKAHAADSRIKVLSLSRNFGHQAAVQAGLYHASGEIVAVMDADLQDPPELLKDMLGKLREGYDVVYAVRCHRQEGFLKRGAYGFFYRLLQKLSDTEIPLDAGDFCVMTRSVVKALNSMPERNLFLRGLRAWAGFRQIGIEYDRPARIAGKSNYSWRKLFALAADGLFAFSTVPLRIASYLGILVLLFSLVMGAFTLLWRVFGFRFMGHIAAELPGWATLACGMFFFGGVQLLLLGIIGEYIARIYTEVKQRPRWIVKSILGFENHDPLIRNSLTRDSSPNDQPTNVAADARKL